jgi:transcription antitermination factor NusG
VGADTVETKPEWYLLRAKTGEERRAHDQVANSAADVLLPLVRVRVRRRDQMVESVTALFPTYLFALFDLELECSRIRYTRGVREIMYFGSRSAVVPSWIVSQLKQRCAHGPIELPKRRLVSGRARDGY